ncbi:acyltransferase [Piscinibacter sp. XHJ-5]|uniref:acyltransferase family protein n=1 Tax=Piscinibacter sp. XHJ-5 TaxID=3037797 RepID=UPI002452FC04|nr:acyltransferase [Piscinibacter sp. XHJ-5]
MKPVSNGALVTSMTKAHYVPLDGLRGLAILLVVFYHLFLPHRSFHGQDSGVLLQMAQMGWMGVDLFFVLSGFLITGILLETRAQPHYLRNFLGRRFLRIWPLYYLNLLALIVIIPMIMPSPPAELQGMQDKQGWFWLYAANWLFASEGGFGKTSGGYFWSLAVEEQFYLVWPLVVYALSERGLLRTSLALLGLSLISRIVLVHMGVSTGTLYTMTFTHLDGLAVGSCLAICARSPQLSARLVRMVPVAAALAALALVAIRLADRDFFFWSRQMATYGYTCIAILSGALLVQVLRSERSSWLSRLFTNRFMASCGKYSYALYLVHVPVAGLLFPLSMRALKRFEPTLGYNGMFIVFLMTAFALSWGLSVASWYLFEKRILALKRYFDYDRPEANASLAAAPAKTS